MHCFFKMAGVPEYLQFSLFSKIALAKINQNRGVNYNSLKPLQCECLKAAAMRDTIAILPTGYGKSLIFEMLPILSEVMYTNGSASGSAASAIIICSPLNSIIEEQLTRYVFLDTIGEACFPD